MEYPDLKRAVYIQERTFGATLVLIEDNASGTQLIQELIREGLRSAKGYKPEHDKVMRLRAQTATIESGFVFVPREAPWLADYIHELITFPNARYCDQADSISQTLAWISQAPPEPAVITYYRYEAARRRHREGVPLATIAAEAATSTRKFRTGLASRLERARQWRKSRPAGLNDRRCASTTPESARKSFTGTALRPGPVSSVARIF